MFPDGGGSFEGWFYISEEDLCEIFNMVDLIADV